MKIISSVIEFDWKIFFAICRFSPDGKLLAGASENNSIDIFDISQDKFTRVGYITHIEDAVQQIDWATTSQYIRVRTMIN